MGNFPPSRHREVGGAGAISVAAQNQLVGRSLPSPITGGWYDAGDHVRAAERVNPTADLVNVALSRRAERALFRCVSAPLSVVEIRRGALAAFSEISTSVESLRLRWLATLPEKSPVSEIHFALIRLLATSRDYPDTAFVGELPTGMPIAGPIPQTPGLTERKRNAEMPYQEWKEATRARNLPIYDRVLKTQ